MRGSSDLSSAARLHVVKTEPSGNMQGKAKTKNKGKGKSKAKEGNHVRDGSPVRELASSGQKADHWDDLLRAWAGERSQSKKGGQGTHHNHEQQQHHSHNHHPNGQHSGSGSVQGRRGRGGGGHAHAGQKRKATEIVTDGPTNDSGHAAKRQKGKKPPPNPDSNLDSGAAQHPDFWHPDGSVIIQVEETKFRLHQSTLQKHSAYFATTFLEKRGNRHGGRAYLEVEVDERSPNGHLPVYRVAETTADDFATLLTVIEEPMCVSVCSLPSPAPRRETGSLTLLRGSDRIGS